MEKEFFYRIDQRGNLYRGEMELDEPYFIDQFFLRLRKNDTGRQPSYPYVSELKTPFTHELSFLAADDTPIVYHRIDLYEKKIYYAHGLSEDFDPEKIRFSDEGILYYENELCGYGRIAHRPACEIGEMISAWGPWYIFRPKGENCGTVITPLDFPREKRLLRPQARNNCVGCGGKNPHGFCLSFLYDEQSREVEGWLTPDERMEGSLGWMHGGYVSLLLDEVMGKVLSGNSIRAATAYLNVSFRRPVYLHREIRLHSAIKEISGRKHLLVGQIFSQESGELLAEAEGLFLTIKKE